MENDKLSIELSKEEAIVLFEFLVRINKKELKDFFEDQAEQRVLWDLECVLEKQLLEPFLKDYLTLLAKAREAVRDKA